MGRIRPFVKDDIPRVAELSMKLFPLSAGLSVHTQRSSFDEICFRNPWYDETMPSLVYEEDPGKIIGFVAVVPRRMAINGRTVRVAVSQHLMVEPGSRSTLAGLELVRAFLNGSQDLSVADLAGDVSRKLWERLGGATSLLHSIQWRRPLRPFSFLNSHLRKRTLFAAGSYVLAPFCSIGDAIAARLPKSPLRQTAPELAEEDAEVDTLLACFPEFWGDQMLRPAYDERSLRWLFDALTAEKRFGELKKILLRDDKKRIAGWYIYWLKRGGTSEVLQIGARESSASDVLRSLFSHAWRHGSNEVAGRIEPRFMREFSRSFCILIPGKYWMLVHAKDPELIRLIERGDAFLSRLEGDLWLL
jgi:hypothetical protein